MLCKHNWIPTQTTKEIKEYNKLTKEWNTILYVIYVCPKCNEYKLVRCTKCKN